MKLLDALNQLGNTDIKEVHYGGFQTIELVNGVDVEIFSNYEYLQTSLNEGFTVNIYYNEKLIYTTTQDTCNIKDMLGFEGLEKVITDILTPCKPSMRKIEALAKMTIENGCTIAEAITSKILMNRLILRSCLI